MVDIEIFTVGLDEQLLKEILYRGRPLLLTELTYDEDKEILKIGISGEEMTEYMDPMI